MDDATRQSQLHLAFSGVAEPRFYSSLHAPASVDRALSWGVFPTERGASQGPLFFTGLVVQLFKPHRSCRFNYELTGPGFLGQGEDLTTTTSTHEPRSRSLGFLQYSTSGHAVSCAVFLTIRHLAGRLHSSANCRRLPKPRRRHPWTPSAVHPVAEEGACDISAKRSL